MLKHLIEFTNSINFYFSTTMIMLLLSSIGCAHRNATPAHSLTVGEGFVDPVGYHSAEPVFSWKLPGGVLKQSAYRIEARSGESTWDSGWVESDQSTFVPYKGAALASRQQVQWRVNYRDQTGADAGWSEPAHFELGLLSAKDWQAQWIRPSQERDLTREGAAWLRRGFSVEKKLTQARLYVTARGLFELQLNGSRVSNDHFANGWTSYEKRLDTLTYDVTNQLKRGQNTLLATLGNGWYAGRLPFGTRKIGPYGQHPDLLLQLEINYEDGSRSIVASDGQWEGTLDGPVLASSIYDGETYDARKELSGWKPVLAQSDLGPAQIVPKSLPPIRETQTLAAKTIAEPEPGHFVFDLGQNMVGWARIKLPVQKDQTITLRFAEMLKQDGTLYTENYRTAKSTDTFTAATDGVVEWEPHFTFHGFRYVELSGLPAGAKPQKGWVNGVVLHSDLPTIGSFSSSHAKLNQLQSNIIWGWRGNSLDIPTDCPQRDERAGWTGDAQVFCATAMLNTDAHSFWKSWLGSLRDDQDADGVIPDFVPSAKQTNRARSPGWMDAATIIPWEVYLRTGDVSVLAENYQMMQKLVGWYQSQSVDGLLPNIKGYGDWLQPNALARVTPDDRMGDRRGDTPRPLLGVAFHARSAQILADTARILGHTEDAKRFSDHAAGVRAAFTREYFDAGGKLKNVPETQTAYVLAIAFDLIPKEIKPAAAANLVRLVHEADDHLRTGFLGTPYIVKVLDDTGHSDLAAKLLLNQTYPSWLFSIDQGATTIWERWNSFTLDKGFGDVSMNSFNHYAYGAIDQWMYERLAGLTPDPANPGYKHFYVRPLIIQQLESASATHETHYGRASSGWKKSGGKVRIDVVVPPNTTATIVFPDQRAPQTVAAGTHHFELE